MNSKKRRGLQKLGFGMSPMKEENLKLRNDALNRVNCFLKEGLVKDSILDDLSLVKGVLNRTWRQDQWDWFITFEDLGRIGRKKSRRLANYLSSVRNKIKKGEFESGKDLDNEKAKELIKILTRYPAERRHAEQIYILGTREQKNVLKIGFTTRTVTERLNEINSATGVLHPFGVRAAWCVKDGKHCEKKIHELLSQYRVRDDREFFEISFHDAFSIVNNFLFEERLENH
jgi:hypothetical protein